MAIASIANLTDSTVAGSNTEIQYNNSGVFGASSNLTFNGTDELQLTDNTKLTLGTGNDADLYYDGTNVILLPDVVGSGQFDIGAGPSNRSSTITSGKVNISGAVDGEFKGLVIRNSQAQDAGTNETSRIDLTWADANDNTAAGSAIVAGKEGDYSSAANADSFLAFYTALNNTVTEKMRIDSSGMVGIGDTANAKMTVGLTINHGANDDEIVALKSSDVAHGMTSIAETDTYAFFKKQSPTEGGLFIQALGEGQFAFSVQGIVTTVNTGKTTGAYSPNDFDAYKKSGTSQTGVGADGNVFNIRSNGATRFIFDNEGDSHQDVGTAWTNFDAYDDAQLTRSLGLALSPQSAIQTRWDDWGRDHQALIEEVGLVPKLTEEQKARGERGLVNMTLLQRIHNGAIWQLHTETQDIKEMVAMTRNDFQAAIEARDAEIRELRNEMKLLKGRK